MVSILLDSYKRNISYDRAKLTKVGDFYVLRHMVDFCRPGHKMTPTLLLNKSQIFNLPINSLIQKLFTNYLFLHNVVFVCNKVWCLIIVSNEKYV